MKKTLYITATWCKASKEFDYSIDTYDRTRYDKARLLVEIREIEFASPDDKVLRTQMNLALRACAQEKRAEAEVEAQELEATAQELLAIEDNSSESSE